MVLFLTSYILAKNHMVTKRTCRIFATEFRYILAKNHMVTKPADTITEYIHGYILAKNHMVTKLMFRLDER